MRWEVEYTDQFEDWWNALDDETQEDVDTMVHVLEEHGPALTRPYADTVKGSRHSNMRELRVQSHGHPLRIFYAFDPRRSAILLIGGDKTGDSRFYDRFVPIADQLYDETFVKSSNRETIMAKKFARLRAQMTPERQARARRRAAAIIATLPLQELRQARQLSQQALAKTMDTTQGEISKLEHRADAYISTLRNYVEALNGRLRIVAEFPEGSYEIAQFEEIGEPEIAS